jgi:hypothetical protein
LKKNDVQVMICIVEIQGQCSGGTWPIEDLSIGSFRISWRYNNASNAVQFIVQGKLHSIDFIIHLSLVQ